MPRRRIGPDRSPELVPRYIQRISSIPTESSLRAAIVAVELVTIAYRLVHNAHTVSSSMRRAIDTLLACRIGQTLVRIHMHSFYWFAHRLMPCKRSFSLPYCISHRKHRIFYSTAANVYRYYRVCESHRRLDFR